MSNGPGTQIDRYEIGALLGKGAMGEVYRARDARLERDVAVKVLPAGFSSDPERLRRFDSEARAAGSLNHPNVVVVYDVGTQDGTPYVVSELLEGQTLRDLLVHGPLPLRKVLAYGAQIARGLAAAHAKGIVHRDLKPENLFLTQEGRVKILDFGLAKLKPATGMAASDSPDSVAATATGMILGTAGYMAPEQVNGSATDHRADVFALGCVLYEMATGERAFHGQTPVETMFAIVRNDLPEFPSAVREKSPAFVATVRRCVEKLPGERFESARDLAFALEVMLAAGARGAGTETAAEDGTNGAAQLPDVSFKRITFRRGLIWSARFTPDGHSVVYGGAWEGKPMEVFWTHLASPESRGLGLPNSNLVAVSPTGELAVLRNILFSHPFMMAGTLARVPPMGGAARDLLHHVIDADWAPDGAQLAIARDVQGMTRLEFPIGNPLYQTVGWLSQLRFSPDGRSIAFIDHSSKTSDDGAITIVDLRGTKRVLSQGWGTARGLAWAPDGEEIWFTADREGAARGLYAVTLDGAVRKVLKVASNLTVHDISRDGRVLVGHGYERAGIACLAPGGERENDLSWLDWSLAHDISEDGRMLLFSESAEGGGADGSVYLRPTDGSAAIRLSDGGTGFAISPDGQWVLTTRRLGRSENDLSRVPTGAGEPHAIPLEGLRVHGAGWHPDGRRLVLAGNEEGHGMRLFVADSTTGERTPISPEGVAHLGFEVSPDGEYVAAQIAGQYTCYPVGAGDPRPMPGLEIGDLVCGWSHDGQAVFTYRPDELPVRVFQVNLTSGERTLWRTLAPPDPTGIYRMARLCMTQDGTAYAYSYFLQLLDLHVIDGLR
jgi:eukaryotic-like serine/threonine-protein kinase